MKRNTNYACGISAEKSVAQKVKRAGAKTVFLSPGSRGSSDVTASFSTGRKLHIQVKATCDINGKAKNLSAKEKKRLIKDAEAAKATPVIAKKQNGKILLEYARSGRKVKL